jgi:hypothetical protein
MVDVTDNGLGFARGRCAPSLDIAPVTNAPTVFWYVERVSATVQQTHPNPERRSIPFEQSAGSAFAAGAAVRPEYNADPFATNSKARKPWEYKPAEARVTGKAYQPPRPRCACCDVELPPARSDARFCTNACRQKSYNRRKREAAAQA